MMAALPVIERKHVVKVGAQSGVGWRITSVALSGAAPSCAALVMYALQYALHWYALHLCDAQVYCSRCVVHSALHQVCFTVCVLH